MINTVVLDIGQVLAHFRWEEVLREFGYDIETVNKIGKATVLGKYWGEQDRGALSEEEIIELCCSLDNDVADEIKHFFKNITETVKEFPYAEGFIKDLKSNGYKVYLLSNYGERNFMYALENFNFIPHADGRVVSYEIKSVKPEPEIYDYLIKKYNINPYEAVFLDDSIANLEAAEKFGFSTIHVTDIPKALEELRGLGVKF
ncbi:MAG: HAD-superfamily hydrolase subfamily variant 3 [Anaerocolumna sp.]|jgi:putative hydrolase of the HAD superfamily|nr:HAD-superfamily hydrolase subfamily variant 3 [Anaerocolumna sp.]